jgi:hypothetical protein
MKKRCAMDELALESWVSLEEAIQKTVRWLTIE